MWTNIKQFVVNYSLSSHLLIAFLIRLLLIIISEIQDKVLTLKYTDIDYQIFTDGAEYLLRGESPYRRDTYRYTPLIAALMVPNITFFGQFGKILFSLFDVMTGYVIAVIAKKYLNTKKSKICAIVWLYNPLPAIISTRGSAESVVTLLVLLMILCLVNRQLVFSGLLYGFVIHFKVYPIIYFPALYIYLTKNKKGLKAFKPNAKKMTFFMSAFIGFVLPTYGSYYLYGGLYLEESWLYHFHRKDPQHNFSPYFYIYHLVTDKDTQKLLSYSAFIPQALSILWIALYYCLYSKAKTQDLLFGLFAQTTAFVTMNKVITSQYFLWYLCLLPLVVPYIRLSAKQWLLVLMVWLLSQGQWLLPAYLYEFQHWNCLFWVWISSIAFLVINLLILIIIAFNYEVFDKKKD